MHSEELQRKILNAAKKDLTCTEASLARRFGVSRGSVSDILIRGHVKVKVRMANGMGNDRMLDLDNDELGIDHRTLKAKNGIFARIQRIAETAAKYRGPVGWDDPEDLSPKLEGEDLERFLAIKDTCVDAHPKEYNATLERPSQITPVRVIVDPVGNHFTDESSNYVDI